MDFQFPNSLTAGQQARLNALGNLAYMYMGMATEGGRNPYVLTVSANKASGATWINGNWWQGDLPTNRKYRRRLEQFQCL